MSVLTTIGKGALTIGKGGIKNAGKLTKLGIGSYLGWKFLVEGESLDAAAVGLLGNQTKEAYVSDGLVGAAKTKLFGESSSDKGYVEATVDAVAGDGTYNNIGNAASNAVDRISNTVSQQQGSAEYIPEGYPLQANASGMNGMYNSLGSVDQMVSNISGGRMSTMDLIGVIGAAYMMFGRRFGMMGKLAGMMLGGLTYNSMSKKSSYAQMNYYTPYGYAQNFPSNNAPYYGAPQSQNAPSQNTNYQDMQNETTVIRSRR